MNDETKPGPLQRIVSLHTPGPWRVRDNDLVWSDKDVSVVCQVRSSSHYGTTARRQSAYAKANLQLIAAAPEMLAALVDLHAVANVRRDEDYAAVANAAEVIAKALGVQANAALSGPHD